MARMQLQIEKGMRKKTSSLSETVRYCLVLSQNSLNILLFFLVLIACLLQ